jgi:pimeloyl-[acyl-carrier protein] methyl ester esterase
VKIDCVLIHGWAMNSSVWQHCLQQLPPWINPVAIDLPGYGAAAEVGATALDDYVDHVARQITRPSLMVGWSLGGLVTLRLARHYPQQVLALFQVATSPRFVQAVDWPCAIESSIFQQFAQSLQQDVNRTIKRFLALQVRGTSTSMQTVRRLQDAINERGLPGREALLAGLTLLSETDLTAELQALDCPVFWLLGDKDVLVPVEVADRLQRLSTQANIQILPGAGHAPMISHPAEFTQALLKIAGGFR